MPMVVYTEEELLDAENRAVAERCAALSEDRDNRIAEAVKLRGLLMSANRYVTAYNENEDNHPQARAAAAELAAKIDAVVSGDV